jgi:two-component system, OmpR family, heavy metal sensor histidine kinase CusS
MSSDALSTFGALAAVMAVTAIDAAPRLPRRRLGAKIVRAWKRESIERALSWQLAFQVVATLMVLCSLIWFGVDRLFDQQHEQRGRDKAEGIAQLIREGANGGSAHLIERLKAQAAIRPGSYLVVRLADGSELYRDAERSFAMVDSGHEIGFAVQASRELAPRLDVTLVLDRGEVNRFMPMLATLLAIAASVGGLVAGLTVAWRVRRGLVPLRELARQARGIDTRKAGQRLRLVRPTDELRDTVVQFNALMDRLEAAQQQLEAYNANVAHELRTVLAGLIGPAELALSRERPGMEIRDALASTVEGLRGVTGTVNDMLFLTRVEHGARARGGAPQSLAALGQQVLEFHEAALEDRGLGFVIDGDAVVSVDAPLVKPALSNLISNATRFAEHHSTVKLLIRPTEDGRVHLVLENRGPAIEGSMTTRIFIRFAQAEPADPSPEARNHGLGLAIVAAVAHMHGGEPSARSTEGWTCTGFSIARMVASTASQTSSRDQLEPA